MPTYTAKVLEVIPTGWNHHRVGVFQDEVLIGEYVRNYGNFYNTFCPFELDGRWYALYSKDYTCTRVMSLPECVDLGGEEPHTHGFCPTDYYVPQVCVREGTHEGDPKPLVANHDAKTWAKIVEEGGYKHYYWPDDSKGLGHTHLKEAFVQAVQASHALYDAWALRHPFVTKYAPWGFVAGCVWGDDSSWKIEFLDLSGVDKGMLKREARFGYIELPDGINLKDAIDVRRIDDLSHPLDQQRIQIALPAMFNLTGHQYPLER